VVFTAGIGWADRSQPSALEDPYRFSPGLSPLDLDLDDPSSSVWADSAECAGCHSEEYSEWAGSRHAVSWTNPIFQAGFLAEPLPFCVYCHAPAEIQSEEVLKNLDWYASQLHSDPRVRARGRSVKSPEPHAGEGVSCAVCHLRDGEILTANPSEDHLAPHPLRTEPSMADSVYCENCHQFRMPETHNGRTTMTDVWMQSTVLEWETWASQSGSPEQCQDCHMPEGRHHFGGAHDREALRSSLQVVQSKRRQGLVISTQGVGHVFPTGDLFRSLTLEIATEDGWIEKARFSRAFQLTVDEDGRVHKVPSEDTRLQPGESRLVSTEGVPSGTGWRLRYHYGGANDESRRLLTDDQLYFVVAQGVLD
jgi:hypothetical protein